MKQTILFTVLLFMTSFGLLAQPDAKEDTVSNSKFKSAMEVNLKMFDTASVPASFIMLANNFERIGRAEQKQWQPFYYAAFCYSNIAANNPDKSKTDALADRAESLLSQADSLSKNNSEISTLRGMLLYLRVQVDPISRWQTMGKEAAKQLAAAKQQDPGNPRPYLIEARATLYTPEAMGGGAKAAKPIAETCMEKFKNFQPENTIAPSWGLPQAKKLLAIVNGQ